MNQIAMAKHAMILKLFLAVAATGMVANYVNIGHFACGMPPQQEPKPDPPAAPVFVGKSSAPAAAPVCLWYREPAQRWLEALPVGNGRLGAMVFGGVEGEQLALNEVSLWSGAPSDQHENPAAREAFAKFRELFWSGRRAETEALVQKLLGRELNYGTNLPAGDLLIRQSGIRGEIRDYRRELDLDQAVAKVAFTSGGVRFTREILTSHPHGALAMRMTADRPGMLSFSLRYNGGSLPCKQRTQGDNTLLVDGRAFGPHSDGKSGVAFQGMFRVLPEGGTLRRRRGYLDRHRRPRGHGVGRPSTRISAAEIPRRCPPGRSPPPRRRGWRRLRGGACGRPSAFVPPGIAGSGWPASGQPAYRRAAGVAPQGPGRSPACRALLPIRPLPGDRRFAGRTRRCRCTCKASGTTTWPATWAGPAISTWTSTRSRTTGRPRSAT